MPMYKPTAGLISQVVKGFIDSNRCSHFGCSDWPIFVNSSLLQFSDMFCDPLYFAPTPPQSLFMLEKRAQEPPPPPNVTVNELIKGSAKTVYLVGTDKKLHAFNDLHTFVAMGFDFSNVVALPDYQLNAIGIGSVLPSI